MPSRSISTEIVSDKVHIIRGQKVMLDSDLADLYGVETKQLKRAVKRNISRFPKDFMFELNKKEFDRLRCQFGTSSWGGRRHAPYVFTEQGIAMLSSVLNNNRAILVNIAIMRAFVKLREVLSLNRDLAMKLYELEQKVEGYDKEIHNIFEAIRQLMREKKKPRARIGFHR